MIKLTIEQILMARPGLQLLVRSRLDGPIAFDIALLIAKLNPELSAADVALRGVVEAGAEITSVPAAASLLAKEIEVNMMPLPYSLRTLMSSVKNVTPGEVMGLEPFFKTPEVEEKS